MQDALTILAQAQELIAAYRDSIKRDKETLEASIRNNKENLGLTKKPTKSKSLNALKPKTSIQKQQRSPSLLSTELQTLEKLTQKQQQLSNLLSDMEKSFSESSGPICILFFAMNHEGFAKFCEEEKFEQFWKDYLLSNDCPTNGVFLQPQPPISSFHLALGYRLFHLAYDKEHKADSSFLLEKARQCHHFTASYLVIERLSEILLATEISQELPEKILDKLMFEITHICAKHGTPGFTEGALKFLDLGNYFLSTDKNRAFAFFHQALSYGYAAVSSADDSRASIHNNNGKNEIPQSDIEEILTIILERLVEASESGSGSPKIFRRWPSTMGKYLLIVIELILKKTLSTP